MTASEVLAEASQRGVQLWVDGRELGCRAPKGVLTKELLGKFSEHKAEILALLRRRDAEKSSPLRRIAPAPQDRHLPFPLGDLQQAFWVGRLRQGYALGSVGPLGYVEIEAPMLDWDRLNRAWRRLVERHEMLRAIVLPDGRQQILERVPQLEVERLDLRGLPRDVVGARLEEIRRTMSCRVFQPDRWPLFEMRAALLDGDRARLYTAVDLIIADSGSVHILSRDLARFYADPDAKLPPLELSYRDYVLAKEALRGSEVHQRALEYWRARIPTLPPPPELPTVDPPAHPRFVPLKVRALEPEAWKLVKERAARLDLRHTSVLLAAFADTIAVWNKGPQFTINAPFPNRLPFHPQVRDIVGNMTSVNFVAVDHSPDDDFARRALRIQEQVWEALEHSRFVDGIQVMREMARLTGGAPPIMPIVFTSAFLHAGDFPMAQLGEVVYDVGFTPQMAMEVRVVEHLGALLVTWNVMENLFPAGVLNDMLGGCCRALRRLAEDEAAWHERRREHLVPAEHLALQDFANATAQPIPAGLLHGPFLERRRERPLATAVVSTRRTLTYAELDDRSTRLGRRLRELGARPNRLVAIVMEKGWEQVVAALAVMKSGAAYVPIDPELPEARLRQLLANGEVEVVLTQSWIDEALSWPDGLLRLRVDDDATAAAVVSDALEPAQTPDDLAYVVYTSGSTGRPKGVMIDHRGVLNTILDVNGRFGIGADDRVLALSSLSFDLSVYDVFGTLAAGGTVVVPDASGARDPAHWADLLRRERITVWNSVPALMTMLVEFVAGRPEVVPKTLRLVLLSGDWIPVRLPEQIWALVPGARVISLGGATEASIWSIFRPVESVDPTWTSIPYGKPMANQHVYVLNDALERRPLWVPGELYIGGVGVARGYWKDDEKTRARFVVHPTTGERLYRTGDWGRCLPDGDIEFLGREDLQVKVLGHRIELGEIEAALASHPGLRAAVALAVGENREDRRLVAYVVPVDAASPPSSGDLGDFLRAKLPEYMVPSTFTVLDALPLTRNGKVDRQALAAAERPACKRVAEPVAPRTAVEEELVRIWTEVLGTERVGIHDNFFELGGQSLQATQIVSRVREALDVELPLQSLLEAATVAELAVVVEEALLEEVEELTDEEAKQYLENDHAQ